LLGERHDLLKMMLDGVYVDMTEATVVAVQPKPPFLPLQAGTSVPTIGSHM